jgi:prophage maintenance system killer protein
MSTRDFVLEASENAVRQEGQVECRVVLFDATIDWIADGIDHAIEHGRPIQEIAAVALFRTVIGHAFLECNHRTGSALAIALLAARGFEPIVPDDEMAAFAKSIDRDELSQDQVLAWIRRSFRTTRVA